MEYMYVCTPKLNEGFIAQKTRYLVQNEKGYLTPKNWVDQRPTDDWYSYRQSKWANIIVEDNGTEIYYTWIPRYEFRITSSQQAQPDSARTDVRFLQGETTEHSEGYQIPEAFTFGGKELTGYWIMKYSVGE